MPAPNLRNGCDTHVSAASTKATTRAAEIAPWGFDLSGMDERAQPGDSFYEYANGTWLATHTIPEDRTSWSTFTELRIRSEERVRRLLDQLPKDAPRGSTAQKVRDYYRAFLNRAGIDGRGLTPAAAGLHAIESARTHTDLAKLMGLADLGLPAPIALQVAIDDKDPTRCLVLITQSGLGLPDREYYLSDDTKQRDIRTSYQRHIAQLLVLAGQKDAESSAVAIIKLETQLAALHWPAEMRRERELTYNLRSRAELMQMSSDFPWQALLTAAGLDEHDVFVLAELDAIQSLVDLFSSIPVESWRSYLTYHYLADHAGVLPAALDQAHFEFYGRTLHGTEKPVERDARAVAAVNAALGEAVGKLYVDAYFPASYKQQTLKLVDHLRDAFAERVQALPWMSGPTKQAAQRKLETFLPKVGFPDKWRDYSALEVRPDDAFGNAVRARVWRWQNELERLSRPTDRSEWSMTPQTVNASYDYAFNEIVFPAAILQPPFFDPEADPAVNYGAIGAVIGHEMGHGFDDQGSKSDEHGVLRTWWQEQDERAFQQLIDQLVAQYDAYEVFPTVHVNGRLTVGENIGDLGGLTLAYAAYRKSLAGKVAPVLDGFSGDQRFFLGWAQIWRQLRREASQRSLLMSDPHSPSRLRVDGVVRNLDAFYAAFDVTPDDALWLAPEQRVRIW